MFALGLLLIISSSMLIHKIQAHRPATAGGNGIELALCTDLISHAGVGMPEATYSNSREALDLAVARGFTKIEFDLEETRDGILVGAHDWDHSYRELHPSVSTMVAKLLPFAPVKVPTHAKFMSGPIRGGLTPVDVALLASWRALRL